MGYATPHQRLTYTWGAQDFGVAADVASSFQGPKGMAGKLRDIIAVSTEVFTTGGLVKIGTTGDDDAYASAALLTLPATDTFVATQDNPTGLIQTDIPADTQVEVIFTKVTAGAGGTGIANVSIVVDWY